MVTCHDAAVTWHHGYANNPELDLLVSGRMDYRDLRYHKIEDGVSNWYIALDGPLTHFFVEEANATSYNPNVVGSMGGRITLVDGTEVRTHGGWSSREGVVNRERERLFKDILGEDLVGIAVYDREKGGFGYVGLACVYASLSLAEEAVKNYLPGIQLSREVRRDEIYYYPRPTNGSGANAKPHPQSKLDRRTNVTYRRDEAKAAIREAAGRS